MLREFFLVLLLSSSWWTSALAQFNDSVHYKTSLSLSGNFNKTNDETTMLFNNSANIEIRFERFEFNGNGQWLYGKNQEKLTNNDWKATANFDRISGHKPLIYWGLFNFISSYSLNVNYQYQAGSGLAYKFFNNDVFKFSISDGILYEYSSVNTSNTDKLEYETFRNSLRIKASYNYKKRVSAKFVFFHQPSLTLKNDYIITSNFNLGFKIWKWINFETGLSYNKVSKTQKENFIMTYGIVTNNFF
ncbi:MAG TPA: DUF481 domain-containing protein [Edaphocola sp.]|nr:DUF481 domain-containing protein [Edaphocola sp.]